MSGAPNIGGGPNLPFTIRDSETQAFVEVTKKYVMAMVLDTLAEVIPFTQREYDEVFKYRSEADRPTLHPLMFLRTSGLEPYVVTEEVWQPIYQELFEALPEHVKEWITFELNKPFPDRDPSYVLVINLLTTTAKALGWLSLVSQPIQPNSSAEQNYLANVALPFIVLRSATDQSFAILEMTQTWLNSVGPNYHYYDSLSSYLTEMKKGLDRLEFLRQEVEKGNNGPEVRQGFLEIAYKLDKLSESFNTSSLKSELGIVGTHLETLATVAAAWAIGAGSPSLIIAATIATMGFSSDANAAGLVGDAYSTAIDSLLNGILDSVVLGPRAELKELVDLYNDLTGL